MNVFRKAVQKLIGKLSIKVKPIFEQEVPVFSINEDLVKRYTKSELAALYKRPVNTLMRWINRDDELMQALAQTGYNRFQKEFKKEQVRIIFRHLGEPDYPK